MRVLGDISIMNKNTNQVSNNSISGKNIITCKVCRMKDEYNSKVHNSLHKFS